MYIYTTLIRFSTQYLLYIKLMDVPLNKPLLFALEVDGQVVRSMEYEGKKKEETLVFKLDETIWEQKEYLKLYYIKDNRKYYVDSIKQYKNVKMNEDMLAFSIIDFYKKDLLKNLQGD